MVHASCGEMNPNSPSMVTKNSGIPSLLQGIPQGKEYSGETVVLDNGYPNYKRRRGPIIIKRVNGVNVALGNEWIVPYSPYLILKYGCGDRTTVEVQEDEIKTYIEGKYIGPMQADYRMMEYPTQKEYPPVVQLIVHLKDQQPVYFPESATSDQIHSAMARSRTSHKAYFDCNRQNEDGRAVLYQDFPENFVFHNDKQPYYWVKRQRGGAIRRMIFLSPCVGEDYFLRLLLTKNPGSISFEDLLTVNGILYGTFREAYVAHGLLDNDNE
ncbi:hypothetical protein OnM2_039090 [Erysiphe neolycopersici]|uniref:Uncharacterized protein n=1 Tax=Erysiphe neolycopersici TaxID=212602 RepID=A0A420HWD1_9PEZI|nr:hypothetical protein OnM2_039090 [Erysiphe neolycopersici]